jgi:hypothetical protein
MMSGVSLETCWAIKKHWNNKIYYTVASCWLFLYDILVVFLLKLCNSLYGRKFLYALHLKINVLFLKYSRCCKYAPSLTLQLSTTHCLDPDLQHSIPICKHLSLSSLGKHSGKYPARRTVPVSMVYTQSQSVWSIHSPSQYGLYTVPVSVVYTQSQSVWSIHSPSQCGLYTVPVSVVYTQSQSVWSIHSPSSINSTERLEVLTEVLGSRDSSVGIATRYGLDGPGVESR